MSEMTEPGDIVRLLADEGASYDDCGRCVHCGNDTGYGRDDDVGHHDTDCVWRKAAEWVAQPVLTDEERGAVVNLIANGDYSVTDDVHALLDSAYRKLFSA